MASTTQIQHLPCELLYYILSKLDGRSLGRAAAVNHLWRGVVSNLGRAFNIWYGRCLHELDLDVVIGCTGLTALAAHSARIHTKSQHDAWTLWRDLFAACQRCERVGSEGWEVVMDTVVKGGKVTLLSPSHIGGESRLCVGHEDGNVSIMTFDLTHRSLHGHTDSLTDCSSYSQTDSHLHSDTDSDTDDCTKLAVLNMDQDTKLSVRVFGPVHRFKHTAPCSSLALLTHGCPGLSTEHGLDSSVVLSGSTEGRVQIDCVDRAGTSLPDALHYDRVYCMSCVGRYVAVGTNRSVQGGVTIYRLTSTRPGSSPRRPAASTLVPVLNLQGCLYSQINTLHLTYNQLLAGDLRGSLYSWSFSSLSTDDDLIPSHHAWQPKCERHTRVIDAPTLTACLPHGISQIIVVDHRVYVLTCSDETNVYILSDRDWTEMRVITRDMLRNLAPSCCSAVQCLASCPSLLAVGFRTGEVMLFRTSSDEWESNIQRHLVAQFRCPMTSLLTLTFILHPKGLLLVAGGDGVIIYRWQKCWTGSRSGTDLKKE